MIGRPALNPELHTRIGVLLTRAQRDYLERLAGREGGISAAVRKVIEDHAKRDLLKPELAPAEAGDETGPEAK
jgi:hypothetical protein